MLCSVRPITHLAGFYQTFQNISIVNDVRIREDEIIPDLFQPEPC